jgi:hypothetical protein
LSGAGEPTEIRGSRVSHGLFEILRVSPQLGRTFTINEDRPEEDAVVILGYDLVAKKLRRRSKHHRTSKIMISSARAQLSA